MTLTFLQALIHQGNKNNNCYCYFLFIIIFFSCGGCKVVNDVLKCECKKGCGTYIQASISTDGCSSFGNDNGKLVCENTYTTRDLEFLPKGNYVNTCSGCSYDQTKKSLTCQGCLDPTGKKHETTLTITEGCNVINENGKLQCKKPDEKEL